MEMDSKVVQSQVHENDEHQPHNIDSPQQDVVSPGAEEHNTDQDSKSSVFMNKVKAKAKKFRSTIKNIGHHTPHDADLVEDKEIVEDHEEAQTPPIYDNEAVKSATPASEKVKNLGNSEVDFEGTKDTGDGEDPHDPDSLVVSATEISQNIATEKPEVVLEKDHHEQESRPDHNRPNYQNKVTDPSDLDYDNEDVKNATLISEKVEDLKKSETDFEGTAFMGDEHHHDPLVEEGLSSTSEINQNIATEKPIVLEKDPHEQGSRHEAYNLPNYPTEVTDPSGLVYDNEVVKSATPASDKVKNSEKSEVDFEGTKDTGDGEYRHDHAPLVEGLSSATEINHSIATEKPLVLEKDPQEQGSGPKAYNLPNYQNEVTDPSGLANDSEAVKSAPPASEKVEDLRKSEIDFEGTAFKENENEPHHDPLVEDLSSNPEINQNIATEKPIVFENDPHQQGSILESYNLPNYQTEVTDPSGAGSDERNDITTVEKSFERNNVQDEPKAIIEPKDQPTFADTEYPLAGRNDQFEPQTKNQNESEKEETFNTITNTAEKQPSYESVETKPKHKDETEILSATASETFSPENDEVDRNDDKVKETHDDYEKVMLELKEVTETSTGDDVGTETKNEDKDQAKGVPVKDYLVEKLRPGEEDKALSEVISEGLHKKKEEPVKKEDGELGHGDEKSDKVSEETNVESPGKGMVDRFKGAVGSWFYKSEENQSPKVAGDEDLSSKDKDSVVEGERVSQVKVE